MTGDIVKTDDPSTCPRCGSTDVAWCGGDSDGSNYYHMYACKSCQPEVGVQVFLVPCSKEEYGHDPLALPRDPNAVTSMAFKETDFGFEIVPSISRGETSFKRDETAFPESDVATFGRYGDHGVYDKEEADDWFKRCLADSPHLKSILEAEPMPGITRTFQALLLLSEWRVKWFSQFTEEEKPEEGS